MSLWGRKGTDPPGQVPDRAPELAALSRSTGGSEEAPLVADTGWGGGHDAPCARVLVFHADRLVIVLEITPHHDKLRIHGLVRPVPPGALVVRCRRRDAQAVRHEPDGRFDLIAIEPGPLSLELTLAGLPETRIVTGWVTLTAASAGHGEVS
jgi:hypothetical protein